MSIDNNSAFPLTDVQWAYLMGRNKAYMSGGIAPHVYYEFKNSMDIARLEVAVNKVIARHLMLHTIVHNTGEQRTLDIPEYYSIKTNNLAELNEEEQREHILKRRESLSHYVYDPSVWPLFTLEIAILSESTNYMFISLDLLIADASSLTLMFQEILEYYVEPELEKPLPQVTFREYVLYMQSLKESKKYQGDRAYWQSKVKDLPMAPVLPSLAQQEGEVSKFKRLKHQFSKEIWTKVKKVLEKERILTTVFLGTCYAEVLSYWSGESDFSLNLTLSNRGKMRGCHNVIGDFTSLMLVPIYVESQKVDFFKKAHNIQDAFLEAYSHSSYDGIQVERDLIKYQGAQKQAIFPIVFTSLIEEADKDLSASLLGELQYSISQTPQVYLDCQVHEEKESLIVTWDYMEGKYDGQMMAEMFGQFTALLQMTGNQTIANYKSTFKINPETLEKVKKFNATEKEFPDTTLQKILRESFQKHKNRPAIKDGDIEWTYGEVDQNSERYALYLSNRGIGPGDFVGVKGTREAETIFKIIGVVKTGAAYVPINPDYPLQRINYMLANCATKAYLSEDWDLPVSTFGDGESPERREAKGQDIAYVIHTSGSTGKPKGVIINNAEVCNTLYDINERFSIGEEERILNVSSYGFDLSVYDIFGSILAGACFVLAQEPRDIHQLKEIMVKDKITLWNSVPAILELVVDSLGEAKNYDLKRVMLSGDWIPLSLPGKIKSKFPNARLISLGGATEAAIWSIYYEVEEIDRDWASIPYGYPLANQNCYVLNRELELCPEEVVGEIYIGGKGVSDGYINNQELTKGGFLRHETYGRIYKTGDLGIYRKKGYIDILGRIDQQVKINGYRVEKSEIEKVLEENQYIKTAFVDVEKSDNGQRIIAYLVPQKNERVARKPVEGLLRAGAEASEKIPEELRTEKYLNLGRDIENLALESMKSTLKDFVEEYQLTAELSVEEFLKKCSIKKVYKKLLYCWLEDLVGDYHLTKKGTNYALPALQAKSNQDIQEEFLKLREKYKDISFISEKSSHNTLQFYEGCMTYAKDILTGEKAAVDFLFPKGSWEIANELYQESPSAQYFNHIVAELVLNYIFELSSDSKIRIMEVGAGTGGTTHSLLEKIKDYLIEYTYTDLSNFFLNQASQLFQRYDFINYGIYDLDTSPQEQGYPLETYDIVLASNAMHDAKAVVKTLKNVYDVLKPGGLILLVEITKESYLQRTTFELLEGFSSYDDFRLDTHSALLHEKVWSELLQKLGFTTTAFFPKEDSDSEHARYGENVIVGVKEGVSRFLKEEMDEVREETSSKLASYMVPKEYIQLREIPLNQNGKVDISQLPKLRKNKKSSDFIKPRPGMEETIFKVWSELIGNSEFGIDDDFFMIGGDSLFMIKFLAKLETNYSCKIEINEFLEKSTIRKVAEFLTNMGVVAGEGE